MHPELSCLLYNHTWYIPSALILLPKSALSFPQPLSATIKCTFYPLILS